MKITVSIYIALLFSIVSFAQTTFTVDGLNYEVTATTPNEVKLTGGTPATTDLVIPPSVTDNGITYSVTTIGVEAFGFDVESDGNPATITSVVIPNTVREIQDRAFNENQITGTLFIPDSVTTFGIDVFKFNQITNATLPTGLTEIPDGILGFNDLTAITIPAGVTIIGNDAFRQNNIATLTIPSTVTTIGSAAFEGNPITEVTALGTTAPTIISSAFTDVGTATLNIPANTLSSYINNGWGVFGTIVAGGVPFESAFTVNSINYLVQSFTPNQVVVTGQDGTLTAVNIPNTVANAGTTYNVVAVAASAFLSNALTSVTIPNGITSIGSRAFRDNNLMALVLPNSVTSLGNSSFQDNAIVQLTLSTGLTEIPRQAFFNNQLSSLTIPSNITSIGANAFANNQLTSLIIPNTVVSFGSAFQNNNISNLTLPNNLTSIQILAFRGNNLTSITIPNSVTNIGRDAFRDNNLETVVMPDAVTSIGTRAFQDNNLNSISIGSGVTTIGTDVFANNQLTEVTIPSTVTTIGLRSFDGNPLTTVISEAPTPPTVFTGTNDSFGSNRGNIDLFVPDSESYIDANWTGFKSITLANKALVLKVFLQGASLNPNTGEENLMRDDLRIEGLLPTNSPYEDGFTTNTSVFETEGENAIVDWVFVELRDATNNIIVLESASALLQRDGDVVATDGVSSLTFTVDAGDYFIVLNHRNHLGVITAEAVSLSSTATTLDFTTNLNFVAGGNTAVAEISTDVFGLITGDASPDGLISISDINTLTQGLGSSGYSNSDLNMDSQILFSDSALINQNLGNGEQFSTSEP